MRFSDASQLATRYFREPPKPFGPSCIHQPALLVTVISSRYGARSFASRRPKFSSAEPGGGP